jgi:hypothetical protein
MVYKDAGMHITSIYGRLVFIYQKIFFLCLSKRCEAP